MIKANFKNMKNSEDIKTKMDEILLSQYQPKNINISTMTVSLKSSIKFDINAI